MKISVIIPAYNHERYIAEALSSVLTQSYRDFELIIINDGSTDSTEQQVLAIQDPRIRYVRQENRGAHAAINRGISLAQGEYISILNSDDVYLPYRLDTCLRFLEAYPEYAVVMTTVEGIDDSGMPVKASPTPEVESWLNWYRDALPLFRDDRFYPNAFAKNIMITTSNLFVRRACIEECGGFKALRYAHDWDMLLRLSKRYRVHLIPEELLRYRMHPENTVHEKDSAARVKFEVNWLIVENLKELSADALFPALVSLLNNNDDISFETLFFLLLLKDQPVFTRLLDFSDPRTVELLNLLRNGAINRTTFNALKTDNEWLKSERGAWEKTASVLQTHVNELRDGNAWLTSQRDAWERVAAERGDQLGALSKAVAERDGRIGDLNQAVAERDGRIGVLTSELHGVYNSTSWKITRPVRFLRRHCVNGPYDFLRRVALPRAREVWTKVFSGAGRMRTAKDRQTDGEGSSRHRSDTEKEYGGTPPSLENVCSEESGNLLLVTHEFSRTGAPRAVLYLAQALHKFYGMHPVIISPSDGPIRAEFEENGFLAIVEPTLFTGGTNRSAVVNFVSRFELVIVTPLFSFFFIRHYREAVKRLIWWIHEDGPGFKYMEERFAPDLASLFEACEAVWIGSPVCSQPVLRYVTPDKMNLLLYGCEDMPIPHRPHKSGRTVFSIVGTVEPRKGQDIFLNAIELLPADLRRKGIFRIIGSSYNEWSDVFYRSMLAKAHSIPEVECFPNMPFDRLMEFYSETDVMVSASRSDPMPISITHGLMLAKTCLCSSGIGHVGFLDDGVNALIFKNESIEELLGKLTWILQNRDALSGIGASGRNVYESRFRMTSFAENIGKLIGGFDVRRLP